MRAAIPILLIATIAGAFALGRQQHVDSIADRELRTLTSFRSAFERGDVLERSYRFHGFLQTMGPDEVAEAAEVIDAWNPWLVTDELRNFMIAWTAFDPGAALDWGLSRSGMFRGQAAGAALDGWAFHDPVAARRAMAALDLARSPPGLGEHLVAGWLSGGHHDGVVEYIASRPAGIERQLFTNLLTIELVRDSSEAVIRWADAVPDDAPGDYKRTAFLKAANILGATDPVRASEWIEMHLGREYADDAPAVIGRRWLEIDPSGALQWLASLPEGDYAKAVRTTLLTWLAKAPEDAEVWVRDASPAAGLDVPVELMISRNRDDPPIAIDWAQRLHDPAARQRSVLRFGRTWLRRDRPAAIEWLEQSDLSPKMKRAFMASAASLRRGEAAPSVPDAESAAPGSPG